VGYAISLKHRIAVDAELDHEIRHDTEEADFVKEPVFNQVIKAVGAVGRPASSDFDNEVLTVAEFKIRFEDSGSFGLVCHGSIVAFLM
jgi:hypothetical protein